MSNIQALLKNRMKKGGDASPSKMAAMAEQSASGNLTSFAGIFSITELNEREKESLRSLLQEYNETGDGDIEKDFESLIAITSEVKAINNQAAILHGERIKKAHGILTKYKDGAFTAWLIAAYGNRQTPYNLMQYYEFYMAMPSPLKTKVEEMPKQAIYTLAARDAPIEKKKKIVENFSGETKAELLLQIREEFPLHEEDRRRHNHGDAAIIFLRKSLNSLKTPKIKLKADQKELLEEMVEEIREVLKGL